MTRQDSQEIGAALRVADLTSGMATRRIGRAIHLFRTVDSTNDEAAVLASKGALEGTVVIADAQRRGRGRLGRSWASPGGDGIYLSVILRPAIPPHDAPALTLLGGVAAAGAVQEAAGVDAGIKWPNDLMARGRKLGGILGEAAVEAPRLHHVILGIGINVNQTGESFDGELRRTATSLRIEAGRPVDRTEVVRSICRGLDRWYDGFLSRGPAEVIERLRQCCVTLGRVVVAKSGDQELRGLAVDVDETGALLVRDTDQRLHRLLAGDVTLSG
jgi:BirA family biotin operon repressor/biotin-[acetyl-CoA-carboxylase] ligase